MSESALTHSTCLGRKFARVIRSSSPPVTIPIVRHILHQSQFSQEVHGLRLLIHWLISALALWIVAHFVPGIYVSGPTAALVAALVIGLINATLGLLLKVITFPLTILTLGIFWFVINALMLELAAKFVRGFEVRGFMPAFIGAILMMIVSSVLHWLLVPKRQN